MFKPIFLFELNRWIKNPIFYVYIGLFFAFSILIMGSSLGIFDKATVTASTPLWLNSPKQIAGMLNALSVFVYFLLPTIIGASIYRDFQFNVHQLLYSYKLSKSAYLFGKFCSSLLITMAVTLATVLGFYVAQFLPGVNPELLGPNNLWSYLQAYVIFVVPNLLLFGSLVFALVTFSRNVYVGFIFVLFLFVLQSFLSGITSSMDNRYVAALIDPFGFQALDYSTQYWSVDEQNLNNLPFMGAILWNRVLWLGVSALVLGLVYRSFTFTYSGFSWGRAKKAERVVKNNFGSIVTVKLPNVQLDYSFFSRLKTAWFLSKNDFKFIVRNWTFIVIMLVAVFMVWAVTSFSNQLMGTETYPVTWQMLKTAGSIYGFFLFILIFLFSGILVQRAQTANMKLMIDATAIPNWALLLSKVLALLQLTLLVLLISMLSGIVYQAFNGYYSFEIGHYGYELFVLDLLKYGIIILFALFIQSFFKNYYIGFFICIIIYIGIPALSKIGIEQAIYKFNQGPGYSFSDMNGYGDVRNYVWYKIYWLLFSGLLYGLTLLFWRRGILSSVRERLRLSKVRARAVVLIPMLLLALAFVGLGSAIYYQNNVVEQYTSAKENEEQSVFYEKRYKKYQKNKQPRIVDVHVDMAIFPKARDYQATVNYKLVNKSNVPIDSIFINYDKNLMALDFDRTHRLIAKDSLLNFDIYRLNQALLPGDTLQTTFTVKNEPNSFLADRSPILENGTFLNNSIFIGFGYNEDVELSDNAVRKAYGLVPKERMASVTDTLALANNYISNDSDWITFEATVSTNVDQIAIAPGILQKEWEKDGRRYFHYKMDQKMLNFYSFISADYLVKKEQWKGKSLEIYYHKGHAYNLDRMMASMKKSLDYYDKAFSPYQFNQMRIIEFPLTHGSFAQAFANTVPFSEGLGFIAKVDDANPEAVDYPYSVISHELAHQWWAHQVIGAKVKGVTMLSESLSEYSSLQVLKHTYGEFQMRKFLKEALDSYLRGRAEEQLKENPLMYNENQQYIHYNKGAIVMYAMSDFLGEDRFNNFLKDYVSRTAFQEPPYTTSVEFVNLLKVHSPDSLQYLIKDMFETITLYDNALENVKVKPLADGKYQVDMSFRVLKYRSNDKGKRSYQDSLSHSLTAKVGNKKLQSLPLADYVDIGIFGATKKVGNKEVDNPIYLAKHKITQIGNRITLIVDEKPIEVGVDPFNKLIDTNSDDNRKKI